LLFAAAEPAVLEEGVLDGEGEEGEEEDEAERARPLAADEKRNDDDGEGERGDAGRGLFMASEGVAAERIKEEQEIAEQADERGEVDVEE
jgi:hypothetical protein